MTLADLGKAGEGGADGNSLGVWGGVRPEFKLPVLLVDDFLLSVLSIVRKRTNDTHFCRTVRRVLNFLCIISINFHQ